ncbi:hypothetical protein [Lysobacter antibioticus]|uniref:Uncharacterized protein n=1 Tax=Lysobacter antibioticus TaxID=84531 RepID=A0A0S2F7D4_LYSAN|nr:hypothetical protein [Lysobacter antibioticus]ALN79480.1 hypothetical protein LA76x_1323 [Lysobacter antibioticus]
MDEQLEARLRQIEARLASYEKPVMALPTLLKVTDELIKTSPLSPMLVAMLTAAVRALIASHPDPAALKREWDHRVSEFWSASGSTATVQPAVVKELQALIESEIAEALGKR